MTTKKKLSEVQTVTELKDSDYILITMEDGTIGKIKRSDLYSITTADRICKSLGSLTDKIDMNTIKENSTCIFAGCPNAPFYYGILVTYTVEYGSFKFVLQIAYGREIHSGKVSYREYRNNTDLWSDWYQIR